MKRAAKIGLIVFLAALLVLLRFFEESLFYDPLTFFFKGDYATQPLPDLDLFRLLLGTALRFWANSLVSLAILWVVFKDKGILKLSAILYVAFFLLFMLAFCIVLFVSETGNFMALFYVRRPLIHPLLLLVLLPAFYFHKKNARKN